MIAESIKESYRLIGRSRAEALFYIGASLLAAWLYIYTCGLLGLEGTYAGNTALKSSPTKALIAYLPGMAVLAWFAAGLAGRLIMDAYKGAPESMLVYARGWYFRKLGWDVFFAALMWLPMPLLASGMPSALLGVAWFFAVIWLGVRVSLWLNISVTENLGLPESLKRSYALTKDRVWTLLMVGGIPMISANLLNWAISRIISGGPALEYYLKSFFDGAGMLVATGAFAAIYVKIARLPSAAGPATEEQG